MALVTYLDSSCLIALADAEPQRKNQVVELLEDQQRAFTYSPFTTLETLSLAIHYRKPARARVFRQYFNQCAFISDNLVEIMNEARRQAESYGIIGIDACHVAAAIVVTADEFYTFEKRRNRCFAPKRSKSSRCCEQP